MTAALKAVGLAILLLVIPFLQVLPPAPVPATAPATAFSAERAMADLRQIAQRPHPIGTAENARVREYLVNQLNALGIQPQIQTEDAMQILPFGVMGGQPSNVIARVPGTRRSGKALLLMGHYDSVVTGPGAADNGTAVATLLETARAAMAGAPLKNDLILLFTDGEEYGLLGARAFFEKHAWADDVGMVLNFEARGSSGASWLFRTSGNDAWIMREVAKAGGRPLTSSFLSGVMTLLPNATDLQIPAAQGIPGLDFAHIGDFETYHSQADSLERIDLRSLQHHGVHALSLVRSLGNADLTNPPKGNAIYFSLFGHVIHYPMGWAVPLSLGCLLAFGGVIAVGLRRKALTWKGMLWAIPAGLLSLVGVAALGWAAVQLMNRAASVPLMNGAGSTPDQPLYIWAMTGLTVAVFGTLTLWYRKRLSVSDLTAGGLFWWLVLAVVSSLLLPGGSYLFHGPLLLGLVGLALQYFAADRPAGVLSLAAVITPLLGALVWMPVLAVFFMAMHLELLPVAALLLAIFLLLQPRLLDELARLFRWTLPAASLAMMVALLITALVRLDDHPKYSHISYWQDADAGTARFINTDTSLSAWTRQFYPSGFTRSTMGEGLFIPGFSTIPALTGPAPMLAMAAPKVVLEGDHTQGATRTVTVRLTPNDGVYNTYLYVGEQTELLGGKVQGASVDPKILKLGTGFLSYRALKAGGLVLALAVPAGSPVDILVTEQSLDWTVPASPLPANVFPSPMTDMDRSMFVTKRFRF